MKIDYTGRGTEVTPALLHAEGLIRKATDSVKILGDGDLDVAVNVRAHKFSAKAQEKLAGLGGKAELIGA